MTRNKSASEADPRADVKHLLFPNSIHKFLFMEEIDLGAHGVHKVRPRDACAAVAVIFFQMVGYFVLTFLVVHELKRGRLGNASLAIGEGSWIPQLVVFALLSCYVYPDLLGAFFLVTCPGWRARLAAFVITLESAIPLVLGRIVFSIKGIDHLDAFLVCVGLILVHEVDERINRRVRRSPLEFQINTFICASSIILVPIVGGVLFAYGNFRLGA